MYDADTKRPNGTRGHLRPIALALFVAAVLVACGQAEPDAASIEGSSEELPPWIEQVRPPPGAESTAIRAIQVVHEPLSEREDLRLLVDGVDVTTYADRRLTVLEFDAAEDAAPIEFGPGSHQATVEYLRLPSPGERHEVIDTFTWRFTVQ